MVTHCFNTRSQSMFKIWKFTFQNRYKNITTFFHMILTNIRKKSEAGNFVALNY